MPCNHHGNAFWGPGSDEVPHRRSPKVVRDSLSIDSGFFASPLPGLVKGQDTFPVIVEDPGIGGIASKVLLPERFKDLP